MILLTVEEVVVRKSHVFELLAMETRGESSTERKDKEIYAVVCAVMGVANLVGGQCQVNYCHKVLKMKHIETL